MKIDCIVGQGYDSNIYIITGKKNTIIDCGTGQNHEKVKKEIQKIINPSEITQIILTHEHYDHVGGVEKIKRITGNNAKIIAHPKAAEKIEKGESIFASLIGGEMPKVSVDLNINDNDTIEIGDYDFKIYHTPGHTQGSICLYNKKEKILFTGDTVFAYGSFGRTDLPGGSIKDLKESIERLSDLEVYDIYPGHENFIQKDGKRHLKLSLENIKNMC
jgi:hydroxyacylglutathione hydrolase